MSGSNYFMGPLNIQPTRTMSCFVTAMVAGPPAGTQAADGLTVEPAMSTNGANGAVGGASQLGSYFPTSGDQYSAPSNTGVTTISAGNTYGFGCAIFQFTGTSTSTFYCQTSWICL